MTTTEAPKKQLPPPGFYRDVDFDTYASWEAANSGTLNGFKRTPAHVRYELDTGGKKRTPSLDLGWLLHLAVLEPERYEAEIAVPPKVDKRTKAGKATWAAFEAEHPDAVLVDAQTSAKVKAMKRAVFAHPTARGFFLDSRGASESSILWNDRELGVPCKARIDHAGYENEWPVIGDLKIARDASRPVFERSVNTYGYHVQAAHYLEGLESLVPLPDGVPFRRFHFFVVEHEPPHCVAVYEIDDAALDEGKRKRDRYLQRWAECMETGYWPGYPDGVEYVSLPPYAFRNFEDMN